MYNKSFVKKSLHKLFDLLPDGFLCIFGNCKETCTKMSNQEDVSEDTSFKMRLHLSICHRCWNYYKQMIIVNQTIKNGFKSRIEKAYDGNRKSSVDGLIDKYSSK